MMSIDYLKEMIGVEHEEYHPNVPHPHADTLDNRDNINKYAASRPVLEHPMVNEVLVTMDALSTLNPYVIDSYYNMAQWVVEALDVFSKENEGTAQAIDFNTDFNISPINENLNDFSVEFLIEFTKTRFSSPSPMDDAPLEKGAMDAPPQSKSWLNSMASKFGMNEFGLRDLLYLYFIKNFNKDSDERRKVPVTEGDVPLLADDIPPGMKGWVESVVEQFKAEHGDNWEHEIYEAAYAKYIDGINIKAKLEESWADHEDIPYDEMQNRLGSAGWDENGGVALWSHPDHKFWVDGNTGRLYVYPTATVAGPFDASDDSFLEVFHTADDFLNWVESGEGDKRAHKYIKMATNAGWRGFVNEGTEDIHGGADTPTHVEDHKERKAPVASAKVKGDIKQRLKELEKLISDYKKKEHFLGEVKPAIFNTRNALETILEKINDGSMCAYKEAQVYFGTLQSSITNLFPPTLVKYLAHGSDGEDAKGKPVG